MNFMKIDLIERNLYLEKWRHPIHCLCSFSAMSPTHDVIKVMLTSHILCFSKSLYFESDYIIDYLS